MRPGMLTNGPATDQYRVLTASKDWRFGVISRADVANFLGAVNQRSCTDRHYAASHQLRVRAPDKEL